MKYSIERNEISIKLKVSQDELKYLVFLVGDGHQHRADELLGKEGEVDTEAMYGKLSQALRETE